MAKAQLVLGWWHKHPWTIVWASWPPALLVLVRVALSVDVVTAALVGLVMSPVERGRA